MKETYASTVLIVDDVSSVRDFLRQILHYLGVYRIEDANNGQQAVNIFKRKKHDIVFLDIDLPDQDGTQLLSELLEMSPTSTIIMLSANNTVDNVKFALSHGAKGFVVKPFSPQKISAVLQRFGRHKE